MPAIGPHCFPHIVRDPRVLGGEPTVAGTRVPVWAIVAGWRMQPDLDDIVRAYPALTPALVQEVLAFGEVHSQEIDAALAANEVELA